VKHCFFLSYRKKKIHFNWGWSGQIISFWKKTVSDRLAKKNGWSEAVVFFQMEWWGMVVGSLAKQWEQELSAFFLSCPSIPN